MIFKTCPKCGFDKYHYTGRPSQCVDCSREYQKALYNKKHSKKPGDPDGRTLRTRRVYSETDLSNANEWNKKHPFIFTACEVVENYNRVMQRLVTV